jgi:hypothetical protein
VEGLGSSLVFFAVIVETKMNGIYGSNQIGQWGSVSLDSLDFITRLHKLTGVTWTHGKAGKYVSGGLVFRYRRLVEIEMLEIHGAFQ